MRCPYCAEDVKDEALVCKHCQRELFVVMPLLKELKELKDRLSALERGEARNEPTIPVPNLQQPSQEPSQPHPTLPHFRGGIGPALSVLIAYLVLIGIHYVFIVKLDVRIFVYQISSIVVPLIFGLLYQPKEHARAGSDLLLGILLALAATVSELAVVAYIDNVSIWPKGKYEWTEVAFHTASITFGFLTGAIFRSLLEMTYLPDAKFNQTVDVTTRFIIDQFGDGKRSFTLKAIRSMVSSILAFASAIVSIATGLWEYWLRPWFSS